MTRNIEFSMSIKNYVLPYQSTENTELQKDWKEFAHTFY